MQDQSQIQKKNELSKNILYWITFISRVIVITAVVTLFFLLAGIIGPFIYHSPSIIPIIPFIQSHAALSIVLSLIMILIVAIYYVFQYFQWTLAPRSGAAVLRPQTASLPAAPFPGSPLPQPLFPQRPRIELIQAWMKDDKTLEGQLRALLLNDQVPTQPLETTAQQHGVPGKAPDPPAKVDEAVLNAMHIDERVKSLELQIVALQQQGARTWVDRSTIMNNLIMPLCTIGLLAAAFITIAIAGHH